jgi:hypothetical protein
VIARATPARRQPPVEGPRHIFSASSIAEPFWKNDDLATARQRVRAGANDIPPSRNASATA